ncbi:hypothetical protein ACMU_05450 [Actibacterium mucosum KCTC 23349]|uniref:Gamma-glutamylcyclotransferase AIG2-like domain-containing protein n=1 Tax=Actibacterium mucosum KCTC 23349 TaxID=1454373 RepID=A0A037ZJ14_9RHOB|nr:gamma-glutamylcyclotransferase family protein [Actibacterium mucosum]KAJ56390.1 hypothetical protein ACMU_05450 [Actibacterium mucosum KCTC 23349]
MADPYFFGYGSLVNRATHDYPDIHRATIGGWRRVWHSLAHRDVAILSVEPAKGQIDGLIAAVPGQDWAALDQREIQYARHPAPDVIHSAPGDISAQIYVVEPANIAATAKHPILLSYLDVVLQGFLREFGVPGAERFFDTTAGWDRPILDDRDKPIYPRHQMLDTEERLFVDLCLSRLSAVVVQR